MLVLCRIVSVHPDADVWLVSGHLSAFKRSAGREIAQAAARELTGHPELLRRNPTMLRRAWDVQAEHRAEFIAQVGSDLVVLPPAEAQETLREHYRRMRDTAVAKLDGKTARRAANTGPMPEDMGRFPDELPDADSVALVYDEVEGLNFFRDFGRIDALFADPVLARGRTNLARLREWLHDESVTPLAFRRLVQRHPDGADPSSARCCASPDSLGRVTGKVCCAATRRRSSTASRCPVSRSSANALPNFSAERGEGAHAWRVKAGSSVG